MAQQHHPHSHHELPLALIRTPLIKDEEAALHGEVLEIAHTESSNNELKEVNSTVDRFPDRHRRSSTAHPVFKRHAESTPSELFYDLFFVANLTTFTNQHEINDHQSKFTPEVQ